MKKNGFTLAEVLITLAIIGVVATMTLPALMTNTAEQQARTGLKKGINTLTEVAQLSEAIDGYGYNSLGDYPTELNEAAASGQTFYGMLASRANVDLGNVTPLKDEIYTGTDTTIYLRDGAAITFNKNATKTTEDNGALQPDGLPLGFTVLYDTNGAKGPNILSNCEGKPMGHNEYKADQFTSAPGTVLSTVACDTKKKRVIKDRFLIQLRGTIAQPVGAAATWVFSESTSGTPSGT